MNQNNPIRLQKAIAQAGLSSRRGAEKLIQAGSVRVNGVLVREMGVLVNLASDILEVEGQKITFDAAPVKELWALYKPKGCVCTLDDPEGRPTIKAFFPRTKTRLFPIGRLDYDAEGLILLTNDGDLAMKVAHPSHSMAKVYLVKVKGLVTPETLKAFLLGLQIKEKKLRPVKAKIIHTINDKTWVEMSLKEGLKNQIKKMFKKTGHRVLKIKRYQIGPIELENLQAGESRKLGNQEIQALLA